MQANLAVLQIRSFNPLRFVSISRPSPRVLTGKLLMVATLLLLISTSTPGNCIESAQPPLKRLFHLVGIPGLRRDERVNLTVASDGLSFQTKAVLYQVPYARIHQILLLNADRRYEGTTYAVAVATYGLGAFLILKKHHIDTVVLDYVNERGGKMGIVVQMETAQGETFKSLLKQRNVSVDEPDQLSQSPAASQDATKERSQQ